MKYSTAIVLFGAVVVVVSGWNHKSKEEWKALSQECQKNTSTTLTIPILKDKSDTEGKTIDCEKGVGKFMEMMKNETLACYMRCMVIGMGHMNEQNEIINESLEKAFESKDLKIADVAKRCTEENMQEKNPCIQAVQRALCLGIELLGKKKHGGKKEISN